MEITYRLDDLPTVNELTDLYNSVGWTADTRDPNRLHAAVARSLRVVTARWDGRLVGLARVVGDGLTIVYVQDILVRPRFRRRGIGRELITRVLDGFEDVRQKVLLADDDPAQLAFYSEVGFIRTPDPNYPLSAFIQFT